MAEEFYGALPIGFKLHEYRIDTVLGQGGFGITYLATDTNLNKKVAIKEYLPESFASRRGDHRVEAKSGSKDDFGWGLERFVQEAQTLAQFEHPHIVPVLRFFSENNTAYMVMAYQDGQSLGEILDNYRTLEEPELEEILHPLLDGLVQVHKEKILHRDIKPDNIFIRLADGAPVLLDFGAARQAIGERNRRVTRIVTPNYAPEEQYYSGGDMGPWTDIYALSAVIYEGITGDPPPEAPGRIKNDSYVPATKAGAGRYRPEFLAAIDWGLAVHPQNRPQSVVAWQKALPTPTNPELAAALRRAGLAAPTGGTRRRSGAKLAEAAKRTRTASMRVVTPPRGAQPLPSTGAQHRAVATTPLTPDSANFDHISTRDAGLMADPIVAKAEPGSTSPPVGPDGRAYPATTTASQDIGIPGTRRVSETPTGHILEERKTSGAKRWIALTAISLLVLGSGALALTIFSGAPDSNAPNSGTTVSTKISDNGTATKTAPTDTTSDPEKKTPDTTPPESGDPEKPGTSKTAETENPDDDPEKTDDKDSEKTDKDDDTDDDNKTEAEKRAEARKKALARQRYLAARRAALARYRDARLSRTFRNRRLQTRLPGRNDPTLLKFRAGGSVSAVTINNDRDGSQINETGRWWVKNNRFCMKLTQWNSGRAACYAVKTSGRWNSPRVSIIGSGTGRWAGTLTY